MRSPTTLLLSALALTCAHTTPDDMSAQAHRSAAAEHQEAAWRAEQRYQPNAMNIAASPRVPKSEVDQLPSYNPTIGYLEAADAHLQLAAEHLAAARELERFEDAACTGVSTAERAGCPLLSPYLSLIVEMPSGARLELKPDADANALYARMRCHWAYSRARAFEAPRCPLYLRGAEIELDGRAINVTSKDRATAEKIRADLRAMLKPPAVGAR